jgi:hypothetical protein
MSIAQIYGEKVNVEVVEISDVQVSHGERKKDKLNVDNINYILGDASMVDVAAIEPDVIIGLHACGSLTDLIISTALRCKSSFLVCSCCYRSNRKLLIDGMQNHDWLQQNEADFTLLTKIAERQGDILNQELGVHTVNGLRAEACVRGGKSGEFGAYHVRLESFPLAYSGRNHVIIGEPTNRMIET